MTWPKQYKQYDDSKGRGSPDEWRETFYERMTADDAKIIIQEAQESPYDILGITAMSSMADIKKAFRALIMKWHPDRNPDSPEIAEAMSKKIIAAYTLLTEKT